MRAMRLHEPAPIETSPLRAEDVPDPAPERGEVRLRVRCCALCRTDLHVIEGDLPRQRLPVIPGHQIVGTVDSLGARCKRLAIGQRIGVAWLRHTDGTYRFCRGGRENLCDASLYTGYHADGGYAEFAVISEDFAYAIPDAFSDREAAPLLCGGIIGYRALQRSNLPSGGTLAIFGFGSSAHIVLQLVLARGGRVHVVTREPNHQRLAREMGAAWAGADASGMPGKADSAIIFAPAGSLVPDALSCLAKGGTLALAGIHMTPIPEIDYDAHLYYDRDVHPVTANTRADGRELLAEAARARVRPRVTTYALGDTNRALQDMKHGRIDGTGVLVM